jgi:hypothetical protein
MKPESGSRIELLPSLNQGAALRNLLYLSYGTGPHEQEVMYSVLSGIRWSASNRDYRVLVYTDHPDVFCNLPAHVQFISSDQWGDWAGPHSFKHRRKILALKHAFKHYCGTTVLLDGDTWLRAPAQRLFERIDSGSALMHIGEGRVSEVQSPLYRHMCDLLEKAEFEDSEGKHFRISPETMMYNAGVIGIDSADAQILDEVLDLTDQFCKLSDLHILEQFAFSYVLMKRTKLREAADLVFHYWPPYLHEPFRETLPNLMAETESMPIRERADFLFAHRPRPTWHRRGKVIAKRVLQMAGIIRGRCRSNEW